MYLPNRQKTLHCFLCTVANVSKTHLQSAATFIFEFWSIKNFTDNRPARKDYSKLTAEERTNGTEQLDNEHVYNTEDVCAGNEPQNRTDNDCTFPDIDMVDREDFSDDSDYGRVQSEFVFPWQLALIF